MVYGPWHSALALVFLTAALTSWYGAFEYRLDPESVMVRGPLGTVRYGWEEFARCEADGDELRLRFRGRRRPPELVLCAPGIVGQALDYAAGRLRTND